MSESRQTMAYVLSARSLALSLRQGVVSEGQKALLVLVGQVVLTLAAYLTLYVGVTLDWAFYTQAILTSAVAGFGVWFSFLQNGAGVGSNFVERFFLLSVPLGVLFTVLGWLGFSLVNVGVAYLFHGLSDESFEILLGVTEVVWELLLSILFFWRLAVWIGRTGA